MRGASALLLADHLPHRRRTPVCRVPLAEGFLSLPTQGGTQSRIADLRLLPDDRWRRRFLARLDHEHAGLPYHEILRPDLEQVLVSSARVIELNQRFLEVLLRALRLPLRVARVSSCLETSADSLPAGIWLGRAAVRLGAREIRLPAAEHHPRGLSEYCAAAGIELRPAPALQLPADGVTANAYTAIARWGPQAATRLGL